MPRKKEVALHIAKSMSQLNSMIKVDVGSDPKLIVRATANLFKEAEKMRKEGDEEHSYILYMRFCDAAQFVRKSPIAKDKTYIEGMISLKDVKSGLEWAEKLADSLEKRYELLREEEETMKKLKQMGTKTENITEEPVAVISENVEFDKAKPMLNVKIEINGSNVEKVNKIDEADCFALYSNLWNKNTSVLIMDARSAEDFDCSHINSPRCINIPAEIITQGITAHKLRTLLPLESKDLWDKRGSADIIYLLDWFSSGNKMSTEIKSLKDAIHKWDTITKLKNEPVVLTGGYDCWLNYYPTMTTNSRVERPNKDGSVVSNVVDLNFDYPSDDLDKAFIMESGEGPSLDSSTGSATPSENVSNQSAAKAMPNIDRTTKPKPVPYVWEVSKETPAATVKSSKTEMEWNEISPAKSQSVKPSYNRTLKPKSVAGNAAENEEVANERQKMWDTMSKYEKFENEALILEKQKLQQEKELTELRLRREKEAEEDMKLELQMKELNLMDRISEMEERQKKQELENKEVMDENESLKKRMDEITRQNDEECKKLKEELARNLKKENERRALEKEVQRLRRERSKAEKTIKENIIKPDKTEYPLNENLNIANVEKLPSVERNPLKSIDNLGTQIGANKSSSYTKLKDSNSGGNLSRFGKLSRAHSFHNISQITDSEDNLSNSSSFGERSNQSSEIIMQPRVIPEIDRCNKPSPTEMSGTLTRNFMPVYGGMGPALTGLRNLGNTCYMNSIVQCLANTAPLVHYFKSGTYRSHINRSGKLKGILVEEFAAVIQALYLGQYRSISPRDFRNVISQYDKTFESCDQQDPQEFLNCVIDNLHEELKKPKPNKTIESAQMIKSLDDSSLPDDVIATRSWEMYKLLHNSVITEMFQGQYRSTLKCLHCNKKAVKFDTFMFLSLPIPAGVNRCTLKDCLQLFIKEEKLTGASKWKCSRCNELREAVKKIDIWKLPPVLLIHFKRFYYEGMWKGKMQTYIDFSVSDALDLHSYVKGTDSKNSFNLYAVTNHSGTLDGGHCIAYCKNGQNNRWFKYDDQDVREMSESEVKSSGAYILYFITRSGYGSRLI